MLLCGALEGTGVSYKIDETAVSADQFGVSNVGNGGRFDYDVKFYMLMLKSNQNYYYYF